MRLPWLMLLIVAGCESGSSAKPEPTPQQPPAPTPNAPAAGDAHAEGKKVYGKYCAPCHGVDLKGYVADHAPSLINQTFLESATDNFLQQSIAFGRPGTSMPPYSKAKGGPLDDAQITAMVAYFRSFGSKPLALAPVGKGDAARGATIYNEYCKACHGDTTTRREAVHLANPEFLRQATDEYIRYAAEKGRPGTKMLKFSAVLDAKQLDDVTAYIRSFSTGAAAAQTLPPPTGKEPLVLNPKGKDPTFKIRDTKYVSVDEVARELKAGKKMIIIDARPPSDWMRVHITGAVSIPYHEPAKLDVVPKDVAVIAYCACPHHLSGIVIDELIKRGYKKAYVLDEGINVWHTKNYPVVAAPGVTPPAPESANPDAPKQPHP